MVLGMQALELLFRHQRIDLGGGERAVAQEHLLGAQVRAVIEQMGGEAVA